MEDFSIAICAPDTCNMSPLYAAADKGRTSAIEALLELGADANVETEQAEKCACRTSADKPFFYC